MFGTIQDITLQKETEFQLVKQKEFTQKITNSSQTIIFTFDLQQKQVFFLNNKASETLLGYSNEEIQLKFNIFLEEINTTSDSFSFDSKKYSASNLIQQIFHPDDIVPLIEQLEQILKENKDKVYEIEYRLKTKTGNWRWIYGRMMPFNRDKNGQITEISGLNNDISKIKKVEFDARNTIRTRAGTYCC